MPDVEGVPRAVNDLEPRRGAARAGDKGLRLAERHRGVPLAVHHEVRDGKRRGRSREIEHLAVRVDILVVRIREPQGNARARVGENERAVPFPLSFPARRVPVEPAEGGPGDDRANLAELRRDEDRDGAPPAVPEETPPPAAGARASRRTAAHERAHRAKILDLGGYRVSRELLGSLEEARALVDAVHGEAHREHVESLHGEPVRQVGEESPSLVAEETVAYDDEGGIRARGARPQIGADGPPSPRRNLNLPDKFFHEHAALAKRGTVEYYVCTLYIERE